MARGLKLFLGVEVGVHPDRRARFSGPSLRVTKKAQTPVTTGASPGGMPAENLIWIFGAARTGSTWLSRMMSEAEGLSVWNEPLVGALFGHLYYDRAKHLQGNLGEHYIFGDAYRDSWLGSVREFILREAGNRFPEVSGPGCYLLVKEPNGSAGAPLIMQALPESRMVLLVRDPRDAVASSADARRSGGWRQMNRDAEAGKGRGSSRNAEDPDKSLRQLARSYLERITITKKAYDEHDGPKSLMRYEDLRSDTFATMSGMYSDLGMPVDEGALRAAVEKHSWENIPQEEKGEGKFYRKATPGGWREDLTPKQVEIIETLTAPILEEFYPLAPSGEVRL